MPLKPEQEWIACKPLADANLPAWIRAIQADALRYAATKVSGLNRPPLFNVANELESKRDEFSATTTGSDKEVIEELVACARKYQSRYKGAEHAQKDWDRTQAVLQELARRGIA